MPALDKEKLIAHLNSHWAGKPCPMCGTGQWQASDKVFQLMEYSDGGLVIGGAVVPLVPITCAACGNTQLVNPLATGLYVRPKPPSASGSGEPTSAR